MSERVIFEPSDKPDLVLLGLIAHDIPDEHLVVGPLDFAAYKVLEAAQEAREKLPAGALDPGDRSKAIEQSGRYIAERDVILDEFRAHGKTPPKGTYERPLPAGPNAERLARRLKELEEARIPFFAAASKPPGDAETLNKKPADYARLCEIIDALELIGTRPPYDSFEAALDKAGLRPQPVKIPTAKR